MTIANNTMHTITSPNSIIAIEPPKLIATIVTAVKISNTNIKMVNKIIYFHLLSQKEPFFSRKQKQKSLLTSAFGYVLVTF